MKWRVSLWDCWALMVSVWMQIALILAPLGSLPLVPAEVMDGWEHSESWESSLRGADRRLSFAFARRTNGGTWPLKLHLTVFSSLGLCCHLLSKSFSNHCMKCPCKGYILFVCLLSLWKLNGPSLISGGTLKQVIFLCFFKVLLYTPLPRTRGTFSLFFVSSWCAFPAPVVFT